MLESVSAAQPSTGSQPIQTTKAEDQKSQFLSLLIAQIKGQDPLSPMDGTQFVAQLAQFSSLEELINIRKVMDQVQTTLEEQNVTMVGVQETLERQSGTDAAELF